MQATMYVTTCVLCHILLGLGHSLDDIGVVVWSQQGNDHVTVSMCADSVLRTLTSRCMESNQQLSTLTRQLT